MEHLWAPWRVEYIMGPKPDGCIFCDKPLEEKDEENLILCRGERNFVMLNSFPYNPGHLLISPYRHLSGLEEMSEEETLEHWHLVSLSMEWMKKAVQPQGFNIGITVGEVAGAGVLGHIHTHIVPRWGGDTNFMTVLADSRVVPEALKATYHKLRDQIT